MKHAVINTTNFQSLQIPSPWSKEYDFRDIEVEEINYKYVYSFDHYFDDQAFSNQFDFIFETEGDFNDWVENGTPYQPEIVNIEL